MTGRRYRVEAREDLLGCFAIAYINGAVRLAGEVGIYEVVGPTAERHDDGRQREG